jgi:CRISPR-associated endonuclease/helicase Cas3
MFNLALRFLVKVCGSTAVLCTATQPLLDKIDKKERALQILPEQQMIMDVKGLFHDLKRVEVYDKRKVEGWTEKEVADLASQEFRQGDSVLIIVNTKTSARNLFQQFKQSGSEFIFHLSTDMCPAHRMNIINKIKRRLEKRERTVCVSTQLIEAGIDIDFDSVIRYLAGLDSIAQAAGRCNRHGSKSKNGNVFIINPKDENLSCLLEIKIGTQKADRVLDEFKERPDRFENEILSPSAMEQYYKYYFYDRKDIMNFPVTSNSSVGRDDNLFDLLSTNPRTVQEHQRIHQSSQALPLKQSFHSAAKAFRAIDSPGRGIVVPYDKAGKEIIVELCAAYEVEKQYKLIKKAQRYSVNVYENVFNDLVKRRIIHEAQEGTGIFYLDDQYYSNEFGLSKEIANEVPTYTV